MRLAPAEDAGLLGRSGSGSFCAGGGLAGGLGSRRQFQPGPRAAGWRFRAGRHVRAARPDGAILASAVAAPVLPGTIRYPENMTAKKIIFVQGRGKKG